MSKCKRFSIPRCLHILISLFPDLTLYHHTMAPVKHAAILEVDKGATKADVALRYGLSMGLIGDWCRNRVDIFKAVSSGRVDVRREAPIHFPKTETAVVDWLHTNRDGNIGFSGPVLLCQALEFSKEFPEESGFIGSDGWLTRVKSRHDCFSLACW